MARSFGTHFVITANFTDDGAPAYQRQDGAWTRALPEAFVTEDEAERDARLAAAEGQPRVVCDAYAFKVELDDDGRPVVTTQRERIRALGPTTPLRRPDDDASRMTA